jgi:hypothetical protein
VEVSLGEVSLETLAEDATLSGEQKLPLICSTSACRLSVACKAENREDTMHDLAIPIHGHRKRRKPAESWHDAEVSKRETLLEFITRANEDVWLFDACAAGRLIRPPWKLTMQLLRVLL